MDFPIAPRPGQREAAQWIAKGLQARRHLLWEAPTGTGKTLAALIAAQETRRARHETTIVAIRTHSQQRQVWREHQRLASGDLLVPVMGRKHACPHLRPVEGADQATPEELGRLCRRAKKAAQTQLDLGKPQKDACPYFLQLLTEGVEPIEEMVRNGEHEDPQDLRRAIEQHGSCTYEAFKLMLPRADLITAPYVYLFEEPLRRALLSWLASPSEDVHVLFDEAHNVPEAARRAWDLQWTPGMQEAARREAERLGNPLVHKDLHALDLLDALEVAHRTLLLGRIGEGPVHRLPLGALMEELLSKLSISSPALGQALLELEAHAERVRSEKEGRGKLPRSSLGSLASFLALWSYDAEGPFADFVHDEPSTWFSRQLLDSSYALEWLQELAGSLQMSGTLHPLRAQAWRTGLAGAQERRDRGQGRFDMVVVEGIHRRVQVQATDPSSVLAQQDWCRAFLDAWDGHTMLLFPSYQMLANWSEEGFLGDLDRPLFVEDRGQPLDMLETMVRRFRDDPDPQALLVGVLGGRLSEGIDFPGDTLRNVLIAGVPYPAPSAQMDALRAFLEHRHPGHGWALTVQDPVGRTMRQAAGRCVRGPDEVGRVAFLDERAARFVDHLGPIRMIRQPQDILDGGLEEGEFQAASRMRRSSKQL